MNGNGKIEGLLDRIAASVERTEEKQERMATALGELAAAQARQGDELVALRRDMNRGFAQVNGRIDNVLAIAGSHHDDHEQRIQTLEQHVLGKKSG